MILYTRGTATVAEWMDDTDTATVAVAWVEWTFNAPESPRTTGIVVRRGQAVDLEYRLLDILHRGEDEDSLDPREDVVIDVSTDDGAAFAVMSVDTACGLEAALNAWLDSESVR